MGRLIPSCLFVLTAPALLSAADPAPVEVLARTPDQAKIHLRLVFRKGLQVETAPLPKAFSGEHPCIDPWTPYEALSPEGKRWALQAFFLEDQWRQDAVLHKVRYAELESVWLLSALFTGHGQNYDQLQKINPGNPEKMRPGDIWRIPHDLLSVDLGGKTQGILEGTTPDKELDDADRIASYRSALTYGKDQAGAYAAYRLKKGEALYSSVVMRYTDRVDPKEVNETARTIATRSGIDDVHAIPPGALIKIPIPFLADPFQPEGSKALAEEREVRAEIKRTIRVDAGPQMKGVKIVLDAGHGGVDIGAMANGVWESDYVYDIAVRVKRLLEETTSASAHLTIRYPTVGFNPRDQIRNPTRVAEILTTPPFANDGDSPNATSIHLRWVLANDLFREFQKRGDPRKTLFISFHADSLHPSARGTMVYVPGASSVPNAFTLGTRRGAGVQEMKRGARVTFTAREKVRSEANSRLFAEALLQALEKKKIAIHADRPIRNIIHRKGKSFIPAVLRHSVSNTKVLLEVLNLTNADDADNLKEASFRQRYAEAVVKGIQAYFGRT